MSWHTVSCDGKSIWFESRMDGMFLYIDAMRALRNAGLDGKDIRIDGKKQS